jgi:uncharacterized protein (DUF362 family)
MTPEGFFKSLDRRTFLKIASLTGLGGLVFPRNLLASMGPLDLVKVVLIEDSNATTGMAVNAPVAQSMMDCGILRLTGQHDVGEAWKSLFTGIDTSKTIAIKVNCINSSLSTHPKVTNAIVDGLTRMMFGDTPFPENNIIVFDRKEGELQAAGYTINTSGTGVRCFATNTSGVGYSTETYDVDNRTQTLSRIVTEMSDYIVNVSVLKNHSTAGVTLCMKNHYGTCNNPGGLHGNQCDPYIPALNALDPPIRNKQCIYICDALLGIYSGGPGGSPQFAANTLIMSRDIVAADYWGREILDDNGCSTISLAHHIDTAAGHPYYLGTNDPAQMDVEHIIDASGIDSPVHNNGVILEQNRPNPFMDRTSIGFHIPRPGTVTLTVFNPEGRQVRKLVDRSLSVGWHRLEWDGRTDAGQPASAGVYYCQLKTSTFEKAMIMQMLR